MPRFLILLLALATPVFAQHDIQRNAVQMIAEGKYEAAAKLLKKTDAKKPDSGEAESLFVEMLSLLHQDKPKAALKKAKAAVEAGLPFERMLAGPPSLMPKLYELADFQTWKTERWKLINNQIVAGPMLGNVTGTTARFWVRTNTEGSVNLVIVEDKSDESKEVVNLTQETEKASNLTTVFEATGLKPNTKYKYSTEVLWQTPRFKCSFSTPVKANAPAKFNVAFGGGAGFIPEWERMWDTIGATNPAALLMLGDNVYIDQPAESLTNYYCYMRRQARPEWRKLIAKTAVYSIWDDHDFATNDCNPGPDIDEPTWKRPVWEIFKENWVNPSYGGGDENPGCWYDFQIGDVHFIMLDGRFYRDRDGKTMLGPVQKKWFLDTLKKSTGTFKVICSPVPFTAKIKPGSKDPWDGFPEEREEIFSFIDTENIEGVFLIAADRHRTDLRTTERPNGYKLYEFMSSRLTNRHTHPVVKTDGLIWGYSKKCSFGLMKFDTMAEDPQVIFEGINIDGENVGEFVLKRSMLKK